MMVTSETTSSELESDEQEVVQTKRSYDCTFCKRGFTNARALGGHMNIHRKERTNINKAKQATPNSSLPNNFTNDESISSPFVPQVSSQPSMYYCIFETPRNYDMYLQQSPTNPRYHSPTFQYDFLNTRSQSLIRNQELLGTNLSLQIGSSHEEDSDEVRRGIEKDGEGVDLELRLGHDPYSNY